MEEDRRRLLHLLLKYRIDIMIMSGPFIITVRGYWLVGPDVTADFFDDSVGITSEGWYLTTPPRSGWEYRDGRGYWPSDDTLLFLPGGPGKEL